MLSKEERKQRNSDFWNVFRKRMRSFRSTNGRTINWVTYPSDVRYIFIRMEVDGRCAKLCLDIQSKDEGVRSILWEQMTELKNVLESAINWETQWMEHFTGQNGQLISRISWEKEGVNFYKDEDWPEIMKFLEERIIEFDEFYQEFKDILIALAE